MSDGYSMLQPTEASHLRNRQTYSLLGIQLLPCWPCVVHLGKHPSRPKTAARALFPALAAEATSFGSRERERLRSPIGGEASELHFGPWGVGTKDGYGTTKRSTTDDETGATGSTAGELLIWWILEDRLSTFYRDFFEYLSSNNMWGMSTSLSGGMCQSLFLGVEET